MRYKYNHHRYTRGAVLTYILAAACIMAIAAFFGHSKLIRSLPINPEVSAGSQTQTLNTKPIQPPDTKPSQTPDDGGDTSFQKAISLNIPGCPNLHRVSQNLYRGAQPEKDSFTELKKLGIKTIVNLRSEHSDQQAIEGLGFRYVYIPTKAGEPKLQDTIAFLRVANDPNSQPVFVHCQHGADRTGTMVAVYRIVIENRDSQKAILEMTAGGFGFHPIYKKTITGFIQNLDVRKIRSELNLPVAAETQKKSTL